MKIPTKLFASARAAVFKLRFGGLTTSVLPLARKDSVLTASPQDPSDNGRIDTSPQFRPQQSKRPPADAQPRKSGDSGPPHQTSWYLARPASPDPVSSSDGTQESLMATLACYRPRSTAPSPSNSFTDPPMIETTAV